MMQALSGRYPIQQMAGALGVARSSYYYQAVGEDDLGLLSRIEDVLADFPTYGYRRVTAELARRGPAVNHKRVLRVMTENDLLQ